MTNDDIDPRVLWPIDMAEITTYEDDLFLEDLDTVIVTELVWDPADPFAVTMNQYEHGGDGDDIEPVVVFDHDLIGKVLETHQAVGELGVRLTPHRMNPHQPPNIDTMWISITVRPYADDPESFYVPRSCLLAFKQEIHARLRLTEPEPQDWDSGLMALLGGTP